VVVRWGQIRRIGRVIKTLEAQVGQFPGRGAAQVEKSPGLNWATQFLTVAYDGACSPHVCCRVALISFGALTCRKIKIDES
jgi:hypothetical protein